MNDYLLWALGAVIVLWLLAGRPGWPRRQRDEASVADPASSLTGEAITIQAPSEDAEALARQHLAEREGAARAQAEQEAAANAEASPRVCAN